MFEIKVPFKTFKTFKKTKPESYNHNIFCSKCTSKKTVT